MNTDIIKSTDRKTSSQELLAAHLDGTSELYKRAFFAQQVIRNTILKLNHMSIPSSLLWARTFHAPLYILGVSSNARKFSSTAGERFDWSTETFAPVDPVVEGDALMVMTMGGTNSIGYIPLALLNYDPIAISQWVRQAVRKETARNRETEKQLVTRSRQSMSGQHAVALNRLKQEQQREMAELDRRYLAASVPVKPRRAEIRRAGLLGGERHV